MVIPAYHDFAIGVLIVGGGGEGRRVWDDYRSCALNYTKSMRAGAPSTINSGSYSSVAAPPTITIDVLDRPTFSIDGK